jgi:hypothetical protein
MFTKMQYSALKLNKYLSFSQKFEILIGKTCKIIYLGGNSAFSMKEKEKLEENDFFESYEETGDCKQESGSGQLKLTIDERRR